MMGLKKGSRGIISTMILVLHWTLQAMPVFDKVQSYFTLFAKVNIDAYFRCLNMSFRCSIGSASA